MAKQIAFWAIIAAILLLGAFATWYFNPTPELCLDGRCYKL